MAAILGAGKDRLARRARGVDRGVGDRDRDQVDQRQPETDGDRREARRCAAVGGAEDDDEEGRRQHDLGDERRHHRIAAGRQRAVAVRGEAADGGEVGFARNDQIEHGGGGDRADKLGDDVGDDVAPGEAAAGRKPDRHRRIEVSARDRPDGVGHRQDGPTEGERPEIGRAHV